MSILKKIWDFIKGLGNLPVLQDAKEMITSGLMFVLYQDSLEPGATLTSYEMIDNAIRIGMLIIIWYGVLKIALNVVSRVLFGKKIEWKIGILEVFFGRLKPVYAQRILEVTDAELEEKTERYVKKLDKIAKKITKDNEGGVAKMNFVKKVYGKAKVNAKTNTAIGTLGALVVSAGGYFMSGDIAAVDAVYEAVGVSPAGALAATAVAGAALIVPGVLGAGRQTKEQFEAMLVAKKEAKLAKKNAKAEGVKVAPEVAAQKLAKKLKISEAAAMKIVAEQAAAKKQADLQANAIKEEKIVKALAKKLGVSIAQAQQVRNEQLAQLKKA